MTEKPRNFKENAQKTGDAIKKAAAKTNVVMRRGFIAFSKKPMLQAWVIPLAAIFVSFIVAIIILAAVGVKNPTSALVTMFQGAGIFQKPRYGGGQSQLTDFMKLVNNVAPMILAALAVAVALKAGLFNIGVSGQMILSGFVATVAVGYSTMDTGISRFLVIVIGLVVGGSTGALMGFLKYKFNINEVVQSIMFNYIYMFVVTYFIYAKYLNPVTRTSNAISENARLSIMNLPSGSVKIVFSFGMIIAALCCVLIWFLLKKTKTGYEIRAVGLNRKASNFGGISVGKNIVLAMTISGMLAGLAGVTYFLGSTNTIQPNTVISTGFDAIAVTLLGSSHPLGIVFASFLISGMTTGSAYMQGRTGVSTYIPSLLIGILLLFAACGAFFKFYIGRIAEKLEEKERLSSKLAAETAAAVTEAAAEVIPPETTQTLESGQETPPDEGINNDKEDNGL